MATLRLVAAKLVQVNYLSPIALTDLRSWKESQLLNPLGTREAYLDQYRFLSEDYLGSHMFSQPLREAELIHSLA